MRLGFGLNVCIMVVYWYLWTVFADRINMCVATCLFLFERRVIRHPSDPVVAVWPKQTGPDPTTV